MALRRNGVWTIGSGKGGVGKSFLAASMGVMLARAGRSVIVVDADLSAPNLHTYLGIKAPGVTLLDVLEQRSALSDALVPTPEPQMRFVSCVGEEPGMADLNFQEQAAIAESLSHLEADHVLIDVGSGTSCSVLDFFNLGTESIVVASPDQVSMQSAYGFVKNSIYRRVQKAYGSHQAVSAALRQMRQSAHAAQARTMTDFYDLVRPAAKELAESIAAMVTAYSPHLLVNLAVSEQDQRKAEIIQSAAGKFLNVTLRLCGLIPYDAAVRKTPQLAGRMDGSAPDGTAARQIRQMALRLADHDARADDARDSRPHSPSRGHARDRAQRQPRVHGQRSARSDRRHGRHRTLHYHAGLLRRPCYTVDEIGISPDVAGPATRQPGSGIDARSAFQCDPRDREPNDKARVRPGVRSS